MNPLAAQLVDLLQMAETPLYASYRWLGQHLGVELSLPEFLRMVDVLVSNDTLRLWRVDHKTHERTALSSVPEHLIDDYIAVQHEDASYDPFGLSLTLGPGAEASADPEWTLDLQCANQTFKVRARSGSETAVLEEVARYFPALRFVPSMRHAEAGYVVIEGHLTQA